MALLKKRLAVFDVQAEVFLASTSAKITFEYLHVSYRGHGLNGEHPFLIGGRHTWCDVRFVSGKDIRLVSPLNYGTTSFRTVTMVLYKYQG